MDATTEEEERAILAAERESKRRKLSAAEQAWLDAKKEPKKDPKREEAEKNTWFRAFASTVVGNVQVRVSNVHVRYEDEASYPGVPFAIGITLHQLAVITVDAFGRETFQTAHALENLRKQMELGRLSVYFDTGPAAAAFK